MVHWTEVTDLNTGRYKAEGAGSQTAVVSFWWLGTTSFTSWTKLL